MDREDVQILTQEIGCSIREANTSLRDQFAMAALSGMLAHPRNQCDPAHDVTTAYKFADAMMIARGE